MLDPQRMVLVNFLTFSLVLFIFFIWRKRFPKKKINFLLLTILISLPPIVNIFRPGSYESGDFTIHIYRSIEFYRSLSEGIIFPSWAGGLNATYGYPLFIFNYPLPYYIIAFFHFLGFSFILSMKLFLATTFLLSGIFMFLCGKKLFKNDAVAFAAAIFYQFFPYHLIDLHFKVVIGELLIFSFLPLLFLSLLNLIEKKNLLWFSLTALSVSFLILSHVVLAFFALLLFSCYYFLKAFATKDKSILLLSYSAFAVGAISTMYIWLTPFFLTKYTVFNQLIEFVYFPNWWELLFAPWRFGFLFQGSQGELSFLLGYTHIIIIITLLILLARNKKVKYKTHIFFWIIALFLLLFLITPYSKFIWGLFPFLQVTGSHRLLVITGFVIAILSGYTTLRFIKQRILLIILILLTILTTILNWGHRKVIPSITDRELIANVSKSTSEGEGHFYANPRWRDIKNPWLSENPRQPVEIINGQAKIQILKRTTTKHQYIIATTTPTLVRENTIYFPGWKVFSNTKELPLQPDQNGILTFSLPPGLHLIEVTYQDSLIYLGLKVISGIGLVSMICMLILSLWQKKFKRAFSQLSKD